MKIKSGQHTIEITHPDKILFPESGFRKEDFVEYYHYIAPIMVHHLKKHPISMQRFVDGVHADIFFQKEVGDYFPSWITRAAVKHSKGLVHYAVINNAATLIYLANQVCVPHMWLSTTAALEKPDRIIFDLDPPDEHSFELVQEVARYIKKILDELLLPSFYMLTGSRGAHIVVPLKRVHTFEETRAFARHIAQLVADQHPKLATIDLHKSKRGKRIFIDWLRNGFGATAAAPYAIRAHEGAPIAMPVTWQVLQKKKMLSQHYTITNVRKHINKVGDIWHDMQAHAVNVRRIIKKIC
jgi:bifunctional non-homologous end joining protein LigD